ncbi:hypothetical protein L1887_21569 [Cichorium endivia]|nr:hypothetical protein L1887_21569 [Cichorium endivia]
MAVVARFILYSYTLSTSSPSSQTLDWVKNSKSSFSLCLSHHIITLASRSVDNCKRKGSMSTQGQFVRYARGGRQRKGVLDLNVPPPVENQEQTGCPTVSVSESVQTNVPAIPVAAGSTLPAPIDVEELDDDVVISSPRAFEEAKNKSRRTRRPLVVDVESEEVTTRLKRRRGVPVINCEVYVNLEGSSGSMRGRPQPVVAPPPPPPPPPEPTFSCPVCMGSLVEEVTTKCGHIFCKACIKAAIKAQAKCPTCRRKVTNKDIIRVYLPTTK